MAVFWFVAPCSLVEVYQRFRGLCCLYHQGDVPTRRYNPEDSHPLSNMLRKLHLCSSFKEPLTEAGGLLF
jgi:hypothetical protein